MKDIRLNYMSSNTLIDSQFIEDATISKKRIAELNESYRRRYTIYTKMIATVTFAVIAYIIILNLGDRIPTVVGDIFTVIIALTTTYFLYSYIVELSIRDKANYDELDLSTIVDPSNSMLKTISRGPAGSSDVLDSVFDSNNYCVGDECCDVGLKFDTTKGKCVLNSSVIPPDTTASVDGFSNFPRDTISPNVVQSPTTQTTGEKYVDPKFLQQQLFTNSGGNEVTAYTTNDDYIFI